MQKANANADVAKQVDDTLIELSLAIQKIGGSRDFSNFHLNGVHIAAMYLSAAVMDCLTGVLEWVNACRIFLILLVLMSVAKKIFLNPDFDKKLDIVRARSGFYGDALQSMAIREKQYNEIIEWICPSSTKYLTPKKEKEVQDTCHRFLASSEYLDWVGQGPSTLICSGRGISSVLWRFSDF